MNEDLISVIMPTYNYGKFLKRTINSVLGQTYQNFELIIIDNFSEDNTEEVVRSFKDQRIKYFKFANNGVVAASRNKGIKESAGKYIAFLDSDDFWYEEKLNEALRYFEENPKCDFICHEYSILKDNGEKIRDVKYKRQTDFNDLLFNGNRIATSATVVKKTKIDEAGLFSENLEYAGAEDYEMWLRLSKVSNICFINKILSGYLVHGASLSDRIEKQKEVLMNVFEHHYNKNFSNDNLYKKLYIKRKSEIFRQCARDLFKREEYEKSKSYLSKAMKLNPFNLKSYFLLTKLLIKN